MKLRYWLLIICVTYGLCAYVHTVIYTGHETVRLMEYQNVDTKTDYYPPDEE